MKEFLRFARSLESCGVRRVSSTTVIAFNSTGARCYTNGYVLLSDAHPFGVCSHAVDIRTGDVAEVGKFGVKVDPVLARGDVVKRSGYSIEIPSDFYGYLRPFRLCGRDKVVAEFAPDHIRVYERARGDRAMEFAYRGLDFPVSAAPRRIDALFLWRLRPRRIFVSPKVPGAWRFGDCDSPAGEFPHVVVAPRTKP